MFPKAKQAAEKALSLNDKLAEAHLAMAFALDSYDGDSRGAEQEFLRAIHLDPKLPAAHHWYAWFLVQQGRPEEAAKQIAERKSFGPIKSLGPIRSSSSTTPAKSPTSAATIRWPSRSTNMPWN